MPEGTVIYFNHQTGVGVIKREKGGGIFVDFDSLHDSGLSTLYEGQRLRFDIIEKKWGQQAINLKTVPRTTMDH
jgi:CspA family cold shock protein